MAVQIQFRGGTAAEWEEANPVLAEREMGIETDTGRHKFGDGSTEWVSLDYAGLIGPSAYDVAIQDGFSGTEEEWLATLVGPQGNPGVDGADGQDGANGADGADGQDGADGADGANGDWSTAQTLESRTTDFSLASSDVGKFLTVDSVDPVTCTISDSLGILNGQRIDIGQVGAGQITFVADGTTLWYTPSPTTRARYSAVSVIYMGLETYWIIGDLEDV